MGFKVGDFKVGDRVRDVSPHAMGLGTMAGTIVDKDEDGSWVIDWDATQFSRINWHDHQLMRLSSSPTPSPIRTVTRTEIVPGVYGRLSVARQSGEEPRAMIALADSLGNVTMTHHGWSIDELRAAALVLTQLADALEEK